MRVPAFRARGATRRILNRIVSSIAIALAVAVSPGPRVQPALGQTSSEGERSSPGSLHPFRRPPLPEPPPRAEEFDLPIQPRPGDRRLPAPGGPRFILQGVRFEGNTAITNETLGRVANPYVGHSVDAADLERLRAELSSVYVEHGYVNSGALLPDQDVTEGIVTFRIVEGELDEIHVTGAGGLHPDYVTDRLRLGGGPPLNVNELSDRFRILLQDPLIRRLNGEINPGLRRGQADLNVEVERAAPYEVSLAIDNYRNPSVGEIQGTLDATLRNLTGFGDAFRTVYQQTEGAYSLYFEQGVPVTAYDTRPWVAFYISHGDVIEDELEDLKISSDEQHYQLGLRQPVWRTPSNELALAFSMEYERSKTFLLNEPFSFSPGVENGRSELTVLRLSQEFTHRGLSDALAARSRFSKGIDAFGPIRNASAADGLFSAWLGQFFWMHRFDDRGDGVVLRSEAQLTRNHLLPIEQFELGGAYTVRGYRQNTLSSDNGLFGSIEGRIVIARFGTPRLKDVVLTVAPFFDYGRAWDTGGPAEDIYSTGAGVLVDLGPWFHGEVYAAKSLKPLDLPSGDSLQDDGVFFRVALTY